MEKYLNYQDIRKICDKINEMHLPTEDAFFDKIDQLFENEELIGIDFIQHCFKELLKTVDNEIRKIEEKVTISPTCHKGCAHCCYFPIITTKLEAKLMISAINNMPIERKNNIVNHLDYYFNEYSQELKKLYSIDFEKIADFKHQYIAKQVPCPLLNVSTNECMAYEIRPIPCRTYLNYCNPNVCEQDLIPKEPFSFEFLRGFYIEALNEIIQVVLFEEEQDFGINYPDDLFNLDYLPKMLKSELF